MPDELRTTAATDGRLLIRSEPERLIDVRIVPWGVVANTGDSGPERFVRGAFADVDPASVSLEAIGPHGPEPGVRLAGRAVSLEDRDDGEYGTFRVSRTVAGDELLELARDGVYRDASVVFSPVESRRGADGAIERVRAVMRRVGIVERGNYPGAAVLAARSNGGAPMTEPTPDPTPTPTPTPTPDPDPTPSGTIIPRTDAIDALRADMLGRMATLEARGGSGSSSPLARFATFGEYLARAFDDHDTAVLLARALVDQVTPDNPGLMRPTYIADVFGIVNLGRPGITAFGGGRSLGDSGMSLHWPHFAGSLVGLVAAQATEKADIASVKVSIADGTTTIQTFAGGSDVSYQLIRRSTPAYLEAYGRIMLAGWSLTTEQVFEVALEAAATPGITYDPKAADPTGSAMRKAFFAASHAVKLATGSPATVCLAASDSFAAIGESLIPPTYGTVNQSGIADASTLRVNVSGLEVVEAPYLASSTLLFSNAGAAGWHEDGPFIATVEDVAKLGQNRAVWSMGATAVYLPAGVIKTSPTGARSSGKDAKD